MPQPYDYSLPSPMTGFMNGLQIGTVLDDQRKQAEAEELAKQKAAQVQAEVQRFFALEKPTAKDFTRVMVAAPALKEQFTAGWGEMDKERRGAEFGFGAQVYAAAASGKPDIAQGLLKERADAIRQSDPAKAKAYEDAAEVMRISPADGAKVAGLILAASEPEKFGEVLGQLTTSAETEALLPGRVAEQDAKADKTRVEANRAGDVIDSEIAQREAQIARWMEQSANEAEANGIKAGELELALQQHQDKLAEQPQVTLSPGSEKQMTDAVLASTNADMRADQAARLASEFRQEKPGGGFQSEYWNILKRTFGKSDAETLLRTRAEGMLNQAVIAMLPPGPATDRDISIMARGVPKVTDGPKVVADYFDAMARLERGIAKGKSAFSQWISQNGNAGNARTDIVIDGVVIARGSTFRDYLRTQAATARRRGQ